MQIDGLYEEKYMSYQILKLIVYLFSILSSMYGLSCFHYEKYILKGKLKQFYCLYLVASVSLGYLFAISSSRIFKYRFGSFVFL